MLSLYIICRLFHYLVPDLFNISEVHPCYSSMCEANVIATTLRKLTVIHPCATHYTIEFYCWVVLQHKNVLPYYSFCSCLPCRQNSLWIIIFIHGYLRGCPCNSFHLIAFLYLFCFSLHLPLSPPPWLYFY